jgi:hypothetical protein
MAYDPFFEAEFDELDDEMGDLELEDALELEGDLEFDDELELEMDDELESADTEPDEFSPELEELAEDAMEGDPDAEDEFLGTLIGILGKALPTIASTVVPAVLRIGKRLLRSGRGRRILLQRGPDAADQLIESLRKRPTKNRVAIRRRFLAGLRRRPRRSWRYGRRYHRRPYHRRPYYRWVRRCYGRRPYRRCRWVRRPYSRRYWY